MWGWSDQEKNCAVQITGGEKTRKKKKKLKNEDGDGDDDLSCFKGDHWPLLGDDDTYEDHF